MKEYIEREAAIKRFTFATLDCLGIDPTIRASDVVAELKSIPAADVVPVVRCGDCKWFQINMRQDGYLPKGVPECECRHWCGACDPTDFCSYGARMDGDSDGV